jgi:hypothetical protein
VITPVIDGGAALVAKLDALTAAIQAVLTRRTAGVPPTRFRPKSARTVIRRTAGVPPALLAAIEAAIQQALQL